MPTPFLIRARLRGQYRYHPLTGQADIRLLTLLPGKWNAPVKCILHHISLDENPDYEALSYVWGDASKTTDIVVGDHIFSITENLYIALRHLRHEHDSRVLWADALCIDQKNVPERNEQVQIMWWIYQSARKVLSWLGEEADDSNEAFIMVNEIATVYDKKPESTQLSPQWLIDNGFDADHKNWDAFWKLFYRPYWLRIWVIQEQFFAGDMDDPEADTCIMGCGRQWLPRTPFLKTWLFFIDLLMVTSNFMDDFEAYAPDLSGRREPFLSMSFKWENSGFPLFTTLRAAISGREGISSETQFYILTLTTRNFQAGNPRDKVYALLGMLNNRGAGLPIDYSKSLEDVLKDAFRYTLTPGNELLALEGNRGAHPGPGPSWLPDSDNFFFQGRRWFERDNYNASGLPMPQPRFDESGNIFFTEGVVIGIASTVIGPFIDVRDMTLEGRRHFYDHIDKQLRETWAAAQGERRETFWRAMILDQELVQGSGETISPAPDDFAQTFDVIWGVGKTPDDYRPDLPQEEREFQFQLRVTINFDEATMHRCFFETDSGYMGLGPHRTQPGDLVVVLAGGFFCFVLRPKGEYFELVGDAYLQGLMHGEMIKLDDDGKVIGLREFGLC
jgi:Heterokaryon incompatibility protein (HET)